MALGDTATIDDVECIHETTDAILVVIDGNKHWIPKKQIHEDSEVYDMGDGKEGKLIISQWLAEKEGLV